MIPCNIVFTARPAFDPDYERGQVLISSSQDRPIVTHLQHRTKQGTPRTETME